MESGSSLNAFQAILSVFRSRITLHQLRQARPGVLLVASLVYGLVGVVLLIGPLSLGLPIFEDKAYVGFLPLLFVLLLGGFLSFSSILNKFDSYRIKKDRQSVFPKLIFISAVAASGCCLLIGLMGLVLHLPVGQDSGALINGLLLLLGLVMVSLYLRRMWVHVLEMSKGLSAGMCFPVTVVALGGGVFLWLQIYGIDNLGWDPFFYL